jgi:hypothetical protein
LAIMLVNTIQKVKNEFIIFPFWKIWHLHFWWLIFQPNSYFMKIQSRIQKVPFLYEYIVILQ